MKDGGHRGRVEVTAQSERGRAGHDDDPTGNVLNAEVFEENAGPGRNEWGEERRDQTDTGDRRGSDRQS